MKSRAAVTLLLAAPCAAQCPPVWSPTGLQLSLGWDDQIRAVCRDDSDMVVAGRFFFTDPVGLSGYHAARWDGAAWHAMPGLDLRNDGYPAVWTACAFQGSPYVGGGFRLAGAPHWVALARWDGAAWRETDPPLQGTVRSMVEDHGRLVVAGDLFLPGLFVSVASYNGVTWEPMWTVPGLASHLAVAGNDLFVASSTFLGGPGAVYRWNGYIWDAIPLTPAAVTAMGSFQGALVAGIDTVGPGGALGVVRYRNGTWEWISSSPSDPPGAYVSALVSDGHTLFAAGSASRVGSLVPMVNALREGVWRDISQLTEGVVFGLFADSENRWAVGTFHHAGGQPVSGVARWSETVTCYANCDCSTAGPVLNVGDFVCFQTRFAAADAYADCDRSGSLNVSDFVCFQQQFAAGCH